MPALPQVLKEQNARQFKFWFNGNLQDGMYCQNDLFYRLQTVAIGERAMLYKLACKLMSQGADVVVTVSEADCSLWANLRNQKVSARFLAHQFFLPTAKNLLEDQPSHCPE